MRPQPNAIRLFIGAALLLCASAGADTGPAHNIVVVLDASGSMSAPMGGSSQRRMDAAKAALREVLGHLGEGTRLGILVFSAQGIRDPWLQPLGPVNRAELERAIELPQPGGGTPLGEFMKIGADRLLEERAAQRGYGTYRLLVVTDGEASDASEMNRYAPEIVARGITLDVIGVDMKANHALATRAHSYRRADDPEALRRAVADVFAEVDVADTGAAGADAFAELASIPDGVVAGMIQALATSGNEPIGMSSASADPGQSGPAAPASGGTGERENHITLAGALLVLGFMIIRGLRPRRS